MAKKWRKGIVYLFKVLYELGALVLIYSVMKYLAESVE